MARGGHGRARSSLQKKVADLKRRRRTCGWPMLAQKAAKEVVRDKQNPVVVLACSVQGLFGLVGTGFGFERVPGF